ncbi:MAG: endopeptidase La [Oscillospiraceae bacterium]|jgi:ATP-dependent Lon protease|nr:endopeptidase La [Oscillospiraceae bacterium]
MLRLPMIALRGLTVFPEMYIHFDIGRHKSVRALEEALRGDQSVFLVAQKDMRVNEPGFGDVYRVGTVSVLRQIIRLPGDNIRVLVEGRQRAALRAVVEDEPFNVAEVEPLKEPKRSSLRLEALIREVKDRFEDYSALMPRLSPEVLINVQAAESAGYLADYITQHIPVKPTEKQSVLEAAHPAKRLERLYHILSHEVEILSIESDLHDRLRDRLIKNQKDYYLREQLKAIRSELGDGGGGEDEAEAYEAKIDALGLPEETAEKLKKEAARLSSQPHESHEAALIRTYLDTCLSLPWKTATKDRLDVGAARRILDRDHYGLEKVKERILEYLAVKKLAPGLKGQILCLVGPPGVGKTSVAISMARAMGRRLARLSLGGVRDEADIRGHRKTYIGAMPGRIISAVRQAGSNNALVLLDEVDKLGADSRGDPSAALLEVLDPEQNVAFRDHYLEVPFDLSEILFITTANTTSTIPRPLLDRMEVIELSSYTDEEKLRIAKRHLIPKQMKKHGVTKDMLAFSAGGLRDMIAGWTREAGVRILEREIAAVCRKTAMRFADSEGEARKVTLTARSLPEFLGVRKYRPERPPGQPEVGLVSGLAWTPYGGEVLEVEAGVSEGSGKIELTGNMGDIMKESAKAAFTCIRGLCGAWGVDEAFYKNRDIHIHCPEGAIPKDGPSAGITMTVAMLSALTGRPVRRDVAMTGEITLRGRVLPIGGLKEKSMAAFRAGIHTIIIPAENERNLEDVDPVVRGALRFVLADNIDTVLHSSLLPKPDIAGGGSPP